MHRAWCHPATLGHHGHRTPNRALRPRRPSPRQPPRQTVSPRPTSSSALPAAQRADRTTSTATAHAQQPPPQHPARPCELAVLLPSPALLPPACTDGARSRRNRHARSAHDFRREVALPQLDARAAAPGHPLVLALARPALVNHRGRSSRLAASTLERERRCRVAASTRAQGQCRRRSEALRWCSRCVALPPRSPRAPLFEQVS